MKERTKLEEKEVELGRGGRRRGLKRERMKKTKMNRRIRKMGVGGKQGKDKI